MILDGPTEVVPVGGCIGTRSLRNLKEDTKKHFSFNIRVCGITHIYPATVLRKLTPPRNVMAKYDTDCFQALSRVSGNGTCIAYLLKLSGQRRAALARASPRTESSGTPDVFAPWEPGFLRGRQRPGCHRRSQPASGRALGPGDASPRAGGIALRLPSRRPNQPESKWSLPR